MANLPNENDIEIESPSKDTENDLLNQDTQQEIPTHNSPETNQIDTETSETEIKTELTTHSGETEVIEKDLSEQTISDVNSTELDQADEPVTQTKDKNLTEDEEDQEGEIESSELTKNLENPDIGEDAPPITLNGRYEIFPSKRLPEFDSPSAKAFEARDNKGAYSSLFALICIPSFVVRVDVIEQIIRQRIPGVISLMDYGIVDWPVLGKKAPAIIYECPTGGRVSSIMEEEPSTYNNTEHMLTSIDGIMEGLEQLINRGITHRSIRPDNLFFTDETRERVVLGDFVSTPPGFDQPVAFETIERGMADEGSRGNGLSEDDMYAFGVAIAFMAQNSLPIDGKTKEEIIISKIETSSFQAIVGQDLITPKVLGVMRGLLIDVALDRWGLAELNNWKNGITNKPRPTPIIHKAHRPIEFGDFSHSYPKTLAYSMALRPELSINLIKDGTIENWIVKDYMDEELTPTFPDALVDAVSQSERAKEREAVLLSNILMILDPQAPIRYKDVAYMPDAFGTALATENIRGGNYQHLVESVTNQVPNIWNEINEDRLGSAQIDRVNYARLRSHLQKAGFGYGIERCLYELNWDVPCQSPLFENEYVLNVEDVLPALDQIEKIVDPKLSPVDRHITAFVAARVIRKSTEQFLQDIGDPDEALQILGALKLMAFLQKEYGPDTLTGLAKWIGGQMGPVIKFYQSRSTQRVLETEVPKIVRNGDLNELLELLDNPEALTNDETGYEDAIEAFRVAQEEIKQIEHDMGPNSDVALLASRKVASVTSVVIMSFVIVAMLLVN